MDAGKREEILLRLGNDGLVLESLPDECRDDEEMVRRAVENTPMAFEFASARLRGNREIAGIAVRNFGRMLRYVENGLEDDVEIALKAVTNDGSALAYASENLRDSEAFVLAAADISTGFPPEAFWYISERLRSNPLFLKELVKANGFLFRCVDDGMLDKEDAINAVRSSGYVFGDLPRRFRMDPDVIREAEHYFNGDPKEWEWVLETCRKEGLDYYTKGSGGACASGEV